MSAKNLIYVHCTIYVFHIFEIFYLDCIFIKTYFRGWEKDWKFFF